MSIGLNANNDGSGSVQTAGNDAIVISATQNVTIPNNLTITGTTTFSGGVSGNIKSGTAVASTSGTSIDFTGIPSGVKRITVMFNNVSVSVISDLTVQLGDSGGVETSGYVGAAQTNGAGGTAYSSGFVVFTYGSATQAANGQLVLSLLDATSNTWVGSVICSDGGGSRNVTGSGTKAISPGPLTTIRITTSGGTVTFDAGSVNILWE